MKKFLIFFAILTVSLVLVNCRSTPTNPYINATSGQPTISQAPNEVIMEGIAFKPAVIKVKVGTTVKWTNYDGTTHTVTSDTGIFKSGEIRSSNYYNYTFNVAGTYPYHDNTFPSAMKGTVVVEP